jgi:superfamily I DNA and/or RNA helicase
MVVSRLKAVLVSALVFTSVGAIASINSGAMNAQNNNQLVNLNFQIKSKNKMVKSELMMPFYQTAELERKIGDKNILIEINPRRGKKSDEISLDMKFYKASGSKAFYKKEIIAKLNEDSKVSFRGMSFKVRPVLN